VIVTLRTDEMGVICDWEKANDPNFKIYYSNGQNDQARFALTAAMMKIISWFRTKRVRTISHHLPVSAGLPARPAVAAVPVVLVRTAPRTLATS